MTDPNQESLFEAAKEEKSFLDRHLGTWAPEFCEKMIDEAQEDYFRGIALLTIGLIEYDRTYLGILISDGGV